MTVFDSRPKSGRCICDVTGQRVDSQKSRLARFRTSIERRCVDAVHGESITKLDLRVPGQDSSTRSPSRQLVRATKIPPPSVIRSAPVASNKSRWAIETRPVDGHSPPLRGPPFRIGPGVARMATATTAAMMTTAPTISVIVVRLLILAECRGSVMPRGRRPRREPQHHYRRFVS